MSIILRKGDVMVELNLFPFLWVFEVLCENVSVLKVDEQSFKRVFGEPVGSHELRYSKVERSNLVLLNSFFFHLFAEQFSCHHAPQKRRWYYSELLDSVLLEYLINFLSRCFQTHFRLLCNRRIKHDLGMNRRVLVITSFTMSHENEHEFYEVFITFFWFN